ncbi:hypothetical protein ACFYT4_27065 [Streptomyces sp. NPDC004609]|uniref:hypothetical protein n=1 Tax=Streptomyces sp. NPDC004609 TaxID=3364704 RepID=UPI0036B6BB5C
MSPGGGTEKATDVQIFEQGQSWPYATYDLRGAGGQGTTRLRPAGVAWDPDGSRVFAIGGTGTGNLSLEAFPVPAPAVPVTAGDTRR